MYAAACHQYTYICIQNQIGDQAHSCIIRGRGHPLGPPGSYSTVLPPTRLFLILDVVYVDLRHVNSELDAIGISSSLEELPR